jgi:hypothetical protein
MCLDLTRRRRRLRLRQSRGLQTVYLNFGPYDILFIARRKDKESAKRLLYEVSRVNGERNTLTTFPHTVIKESPEIRLEP